MSAHHHAAPWTPATHRSTDDADPDLRISDAERAEAADRLSEHYGEGRLDKAEFDERLERAMRATTNSDLAALFADLPGAVAPPRRGRRGRPRGRRLHRAAVLVLVIVAAAAAGHALARPYVLWLLITLVALAWLRPHRSRSRRP